VEGYEMNSEKDPLERNCIYKNGINSNKQPAGNDKNRSSLLFAETPFLFEDQTSNYFKDIKVTLSITAKIKRNRYLAGTRTSLVVLLYRYRRFFKI